MMARSFAHSSPGCEPIGVILTFCASAGNAASKRANAAQAIFMSFLLKKFDSRSARRHAMPHTPGERLLKADDISRRRRMGLPFTSVCAHFATDRNRRRTGAAHQARDSAQAAAPAFGRSGAVGWA